MNRRRGFTLTEAMIAVAILGILSAIAIPAFSTYVYRSRLAEATRFLGEIKAKQEAYRDEFGQYCPVNGEVWGNYNPAAMPGPNPVMWQSTPEWNQLGAAPDAPVRFQYGTVAGVPGSPAPAETNLDTNDHWFAARAQGDLNQDGESFFLQIHSQASYIINSAGDHGGWK